VGKCTNVKSGGTYLTGGVYNIFIKVSQRLLWAAWAARVQIKVSDTANRIVFVQLFTVNA
jgi:hypothetical protein